MSENTKRIRRGHYSDENNRYWWTWTCEICSDFRKYLNKEAMLSGSVAHRDEHRNGQ